MHEELTDNDLFAHENGDNMVFDIESYPNYFLIMFKHLKSSKFVSFEMMHETDRFDQYTCDKLLWVVKKYKLLGFNSKKFDMILLKYSLTGAICKELQIVCQALINPAVNSSPYMMIKKLGLKYDEIGDHIDLIDVCPLIGGLKLYGARIHCASIQELPYDPLKPVCPEQMENLKLYCGNDLAITSFIYENLRGQIAMRERLGKKYGIDLRSSSDAKIAESVLTSEIQRKLGRKIDRPEMMDGKYFYHVPHASIVFQTPKFQAFFKHIIATQYSIDGEYKLVPKTPDGKKLTLEVEGAVYKMGRGGIHSSEKVKSYKSGNGMLISDFDVASFYPRIKLNQGLHPKHLPKDLYLAVYNELVDERLIAKGSSYDKEGIVIMEMVETADGLKIVINGTFGKTGSRFSIVYDPEILIAVTLSGQLYLLMLIEAFTSQGVEVISANTDGIVTYYKEEQRELVLNTIKWFEWACKFEMEETRYSSIYFHSVNSYIAVAEKGKVKGKGEFANPWNDSKSAIFRFHKNPKHTICIEAVIAFIKDGTPIRETIRNCKDITKFVVVKQVTGGAEKRGIYVGKVVRWYYKKDETECLLYCTNGHKVPESEGAWPLMTLCEHVPDDVDYLRYIDIANKMLVNINAKDGVKQGSLF